uniref:Transmembrane protein 241 n=1 Tax=Mola mola TaxID=94237 RepID=A0A3Q3WDL7_MOLML
ILNLVWCWSISWCQTDMSPSFFSQFVLSVLKFTYPTLFQGWQTFIGAVLLLLSGKLGWVEMSRIPRSAAISWFPGSLLFVGNIYAGSRALSRIVCPFMNSAFAALLSICSEEAGYFGYLWAVGHLVCVGKSQNLQRDLLNCVTLCSELNNYNVYIFPTSVLLLATAAHPTGDLMGALDFPFLKSHRFHCGCCASALLGFLLLLATVRLKSGFSLEHYGFWIFISKVIDFHHLSSVHRIIRC